ncbi:ABC transporter permease subunit [Schumannella luteola]|uniref:ABC-type transport system involved in multi-copper enzyme maturation permease subunit n=1 Tax=Schumannella luteola TaxID=472059 RepID=A0A852YHN2_9MICO|nr:ABC-type transport system involved in multi-copper enzyme maturation permease subunit [Schumannella luteola]
MIPFLTGVRVIAGIELRQRVRGVAWYVLVGIFGLVVLIVTALLIWGFRSLSGGYDSDPAGNAIFSTIVYLVLLLGTLVAPAFSGNAINGDRESGTLATTQVTLVSTTQLVIGKFVAAWISSLAFLAIAAPFLVVSLVIGGTTVGMVLVSLLVLALELAVISAIGVGLSGLLRRPLFSVAVTYLVVAALSVGTLISFGLGTLVAQERYEYRSASYAYDDSTGNSECIVSDTTSEGTRPRPDYVWWLLAANPYVVMADAVPTRYGRGDAPNDLFGWIKLGVRSLQQPPDASLVDDPCNYRSDRSPSPHEIIDRSVPSWFVGLAIHLALAALALAGAIRATRAPARRLAAGSRIA